jgi:GNAT superfamily N-acetyltransferase
VAPTLRRLALPIGDALAQAIEDFNCVGDGDGDDPVASTVCEFLVERKFEPGLRAGISSTYLLVDPEQDPELVGYATLTFDSIRLTNTERKRLEDLVGIRQFGALRIQMIGIDHRLHRNGNGTALLEAITGVARQTASAVAFRYLLADANLRKVEWYENAGFVRNQHQTEVERLEDRGRSVSMRLDLLEGLGIEPGAGSASASRTAARLK